MLLNIKVRGDDLFTSMLTVGEVLVQPRATGDTPLAERYEDLLSRGTTLISFDLAVPQRFPLIRSDPTIKPADAIQLACAAAAGIDLFTTNDDHLSKKIVRGIHFITSLARAPF